MIRVVIAEDQALVLGALARLLDLEADITVVAIAHDGAEALTLVRDLVPDVLMTDIEMPQMTGLDVAAAIRDAKLPTTVLVVTIFDRPGYLRRAADAGVAGYLLKDSPFELLADTIRKIAAGQRPIDPLISTALWSTPADRLSERERAVLRLAEEGRSNKEIARSLGLSPGTVRNYLSEAASKIGASNRTEAGRIARHNGWL